MRLLINLILWHACIKVCVRFELEKEVQDVNQQKDLKAMSIGRRAANRCTYDAGSAADFQSIPIGSVNVGERCVEGGLEMPISTIMIQA